MAQVNAKCTNCNMEIVIDDQKDADICLHCGSAFVSEKAIKLYKAESEEQTHIRARKRRHRWKSIGMALLCALECIGYLLYVIFFMWLFFDIVDNIKKK